MTTGRPATDLGIDPAPVSMVGREREVAALREAWAATRRGEGGVVVVLGDAAMGKSSLLASLARHVGTPAARVTGRGGPLRRPMAVATELAEALDPSTPEPFGDEIDPMVVAKLLCELLQRADDSGPSVVVVDDLHDLDPVSGTALNLALRSFVPRCLMVVLAGRPTDAVRSFAEGFRTIEVPPLGAAAARELLDGASSVPVAPTVARRLLDAAAGNPLALIELPAHLDPAHLTGERLLPDPLPLAGDLRDAFTSPLAALTRQGRDVLELAAASSDGSWAVLCEAAPDAAEQALVELEAAGLGHLEEGRLVLRHPLLRSAALAGMPAQRHRDLHRRLAEVDGLAPEVRLLHRAHATVGPDEALADGLIQAAGALRERGGPEAAARLLDRAVELTGDEDRRWRARIDAADALAVSGAARAARHRLRAVQDSGPAEDLRTETSLRLAWLDALGGDPLGAWNLLQEALDAASDDDRARLHAAMSVPLGMVGMAQQIQAQAARALELSPTSSVPSQVARVVHAHAQISLDEPAGREAARALVGRVDLVAAVDHDPLFGLHIGRLLGLAEEYDAAEEALAALRRRNRGEGARTSLAMTTGALCDVRVRSSRLEAARPVADEAIALSFATGQRAFAPFWLALRARLHAGRGDHARAASDLHDGFRIADELSLMGARYFLLGAAGLDALTRGDHDEVVVHLEECRLFDEVAGGHAPNLGRWRPDLVSAHLRRGDPDAARQVAEPLIAAGSEPGAGRWTRAAARWSSGLVAGASDPPAAVVGIAEAVDTFDPVVDRFDRSRALLDLADASRRAGAGRAAVAALLAEARLALRLVGATAWERRADAPEVDTTPASDALTSLSEAEVAVLAAVSEGCTNQQVASRLHISPKTVANHLSRIYRKLGVASRTEAARLYLTL